MNLDIIDQYGLPIAGVIALAAIAQALGFLPENTAELGSNGADGKDGLSPEMLAMTAMKDELILIKEDMAKLVKGFGGDPGVVGQYATNIGKASPDEVKVKSTDGSSGN